MVGSFNTVTTTEAEDGPLALSQDRLDRVIHALVDEVPVWDGGTCRWKGSVYARLRQALRGRRGAGGLRLVAGPRTPCSVSVLDLVVAVDCAVARWEPDDKGDTADKLRRLVDRGWRPQDVAGMDSYAAQL